jgi:hypothetical protein
VVRRLLDAQLKVRPDRFGGDIEADSQQDKDRVALEMGEIINNLDKERL